jgi:hypothetical protein
MLETGQGPSVRKHQFCAKELKEACEKLGFV